MKIAIIGRSQFLYYTAELLLKEGYCISLVITAPSAPEYTKKENDFQSLAAKANAKFFLTKTLNDPNLFSTMKSLDLDIGVSVNWISIIKQSHIDCFKLGILNAHLGDLPRYRGNACPNWAIINGEKKVVLSIHLMEGDKLDCGRIIIQDQYPLTDDTYICDIYKWTEEVMPNLFLQALKLLKENPDYTLKYAAIDSPDSSRCYPRLPSDSRIDWSKSAIEIHRLIRASSRPFSGAFCYIDGKTKMIIWRAQLFEDNEQYYAIPGQISQIGDDYLVVITGKGKLKVTEWTSKIKIKSIRTRLT